MFEFGFFFVLGFFSASRIFLYFPTPLFFFRHRFVHRCTVEKPSSRRSECIDCFESFYLVAFRGKSGVKSISRSRSRHRKISSKIHARDFFVPLFFRVVQGTPLSLFFFFFSPSPPVDADVIIFFFVSSPLFFSHNDQSKQQVKHDENEHRTSVARANREDGSLSWNDFLTL